MLQQLQIMEDLESFGKFALQILDILQPYKNSAIIGISVMAPILKFSGVRVGPGSPGNEIFVVFVEQYKFCKSSSGEKYLGKCRKFSS
jgi:hypothetical protein